VDGTQLTRAGKIEDRQADDRPLRFREGSGRWLDASSEPELQRLIDACRDDLRLATGSRPEPNEAQVMLHHRPAGVTDDQRLALGIYDEHGNLSAALDAYRDFPRPGAWYLALILVHPDLRGRGVATGLLARLERIAAAHGGEGIHVIAPARNPAVLQLLRRSGFDPQREVTLPLSGRALRGFHLVRRLGASQPASAA
jgi:GNAT superfamily N-acetyltransferase